MPSESQPQTDNIAVVATPVLESLTRGEIDVQVRTAKSYPRQIAKFRAEAAAMVTSSQEIAEACIYALPRAGKSIEGGSIRLAEIVNTCWGNTRVGTRVVDVDQTHVTAQSVCFDLERNVAVTIEKKRRITNKHGERFNEDMITVTANAASSIAMRDAIFRVVPRVYVDELYQAARQCAIGQAETLANTRAKMFSYFAKMGATADRVLAALGKMDESEVTLNDIATLKGSATLIKEGQATVDAIFPIVGTPPQGAKPSRTEALAGQLAGMTNETSPAPASAADAGDHASPSPERPAPSPAPPAAPPPAESSESAEIVRTPDEIRQMIRDKMGKQLPSTCYAELMTEAGFATKEAVTNCTDVTALLRLERVIEVEIMVHGARQILVNEIVKDLGAIGPGWEKVLANLGFANVNALRACTDRERLEKVAVHVKRAISEG